MGLASLLDERELRVCKETGCEPERFAELRIREHASRKGMDPDTAVQVLRATCAAMPPRDDSPAPAVIKKALGLPDASTVADCVSAIEALKLQATPAPVAPGPSKGMATAAVKKAKCQHGICLKSCPAGSEGCGGNCLTTHKAAVGKLKKSGTLSNVSAAALARMGGK